MLREFARRFEGSTGCCMLRRCSSSDRSTATASTCRRRSRTSVPFDAGYRQSNAAIPTPPVTKALREFQAAGRSDTEAKLKMVAWANKQPASAGAHAGQAHAGRRVLRSAPARPGLASALCC